MYYEYRKIQNTLKALMKSKKMTYETMAQTLDVSSATVKRRLNGDDITLQQLKEFSDAFSISFYELIELSKAEKREPHTFTTAQEKYLASDLKIMKAFHSIISGQSFAAVKTKLQFSDSELRRVAREFEKVGLAQLNPRDRFAPLVHFPFKWQPDGLLTRTYDPLLFQTIINRIKSGPKDFRFYKKFELALSPEAQKTFCKEIEAVYLKYQGLSETHLNSTVDFKHLVSGLLFIDQFSIWPQTDPKD